MQKLQSEVIEEWPGRDCRVFAQFLKARTSYLLSLQIPLLFSSGINGGGIGGDASRWRAGGGEELYPSAIWGPKHPARLRYTSWQEGIRSTA